MEVGTVVARLTDFEFGLIIMAMLLYVGIKDRTNKEKRVCASDKHLIMELTMRLSSKQNLLKAISVVF